MNYNRRHNDTNKRMMLVLNGFSCGWDELVLVDAEKKVVARSNIKRRQSNRLFVSLFNAGDENQRARMIGNLTDGDCFELGSDAVDRVIAEL